MQDLGAALAAICDAQPFSTSYQVKDLVTGRDYARAADIPTPSASTRKTSILMAAMAAVHGGQLRLDQKVTVEARLQKDVNSGTYQHMTPGCVMPLRDALVNMIITSDNVSTQIVLELLGTDAVNAFCRRIGMTGTTHRGLIPPAGLAWDHPAEAVATTTPKDQVLLLDLMLKGAADEKAATILGASPMLCKLGLDILSWQKLKTMIPALLPASTKVAHKTGRGARGRSDAGIVYRGDAPIFILAAYTDRVPETMPDGLPGFAAAFGTVARLSRACWDSIGR